MAAIELRPLSIGELLDRTFTYYRRYFLLFVGIMALPQVLMVALSLGVQALRLTTPLQPEGKDPSQVLTQLPTFFAGLMITMVVFGIAAIIIFSVVHGATAFALSEVHLGRTTTIANAFRGLHGKVWRLLDVVFSIFLRVMGIFFLFILVLGLLAGLIGAISGEGKPDPVLIILFILVILGGMVCTVVLACILMMRYALSVPAVVLENVSARQAIRRSVALAKGNLGRIFLIFLLMYMINAVVVSLFQGPFMLAMIFVGIRNGTMPFWLSLPMTVSGGIGGALSGPLMVIALTLLYFDARVRKEGFDLQLMMANLNQSGAGAAPPTVVAPAIPPASTI